MLKTPLSKLFSSVIDELRFEVTSKRLIQGFLTLGSVTMLGTAILAPNQPKQNIAWELGLMSMFGFAGAYVSYAREDVETRHGTFIDLNREHYKQEITLEHGLNSIQKEIKGELLISNYINTLPTDAQIRYMQKYGLEGLVAIPVRKPEDQQNGVTNTPSEGDLRVTYNKASLIAQMKTIEVKSKIDMSWLDEKFIYSSCVIAGAKNRGKSHLMKFRASQFFLLNPGCKIYIFDTHYDPDEQLEEPWLKGMPMDIMLRGKDSIVFKSAEDIYDQCVQIKKLFIERVDKSQKVPKVQPIHIYIDEIESLKQRLSVEKFKLIVDLIMMIQDEGRKYGVELDLGMHSMKKENTGIDSGTIAQMSWVLFEKMAYDTTTKYPSDFNSAEIKIRAREIKIPDNEGRVIVVLKPTESDALVTILPLLRIDSISVPETDNTVIPDERDNTIQSEDIGEWSDEEIWGEAVSPTRTPIPNPESSDKPDYYGLMEQWFNDCQRVYGRLPALKDVKHAWKEWTGVTLKDQSLQDLFDKIKTRLDKNLS